MKAVTVALWLGLCGGAALAGEAQLSEALSKEQDCRYQAQVAAAVQKARLDGVRRRKVAAAIARSGPDWPARYNNAIPIFVDAIYGMKKRALRKVDLGAQWMEMCMSGGQPPAAE